jgi:hypothetical protein
MPNILFIGDIVGKPGREMVVTHLPALKKQYAIDLTIANVENAAGGFGITHSILKELLAAGIDCATTGNHVYDKRDMLTQPWPDKLARPANFPGDHPGKKVLYIDFLGTQIAIINLLGRVFMHHMVECPFRWMDTHLPEIQARTPNIFVDFHAEASSEKEALGWHLAGRVSAVCGTHTHVATADERLLLQHTAFISDTGMTGPSDGILGMARAPIIQKFIDQKPVRFEVAEGLEKMLNAVTITVDSKTGVAHQIARVRISA